ncbi:MAG: DsbA family oxidoreductase, partial [Bryobacteraceae bacterium]
MRLTITNYLDVISSWCFWAVPAWEELRERYSDRVDFNWKIALMDKTGLPPTRRHMDWFYRRSGMLMRSPVMLQTSWHDESRGEYPEPNCVAEAARELGVVDDRIWKALMKA